MEQPVGLVLCGGSSSRLGVDKSTIDYHGMPQWRYVAWMLSKGCDEVLVSCNAQQAAGFARDARLLKDTSICADDARFGGRGPMSGVLTAMELRPAVALLVVGCDYPLLEPTDLETLLQARTETCDAVCYQVRSENLDLPFPAIYTPTIRSALVKLFEEGDYSLRTGLKHGRTIRLDPPNPDRLVSANTPEEVSKIQKLVSKQT